jgi:hypothetical protein
MTALRSLRGERGPLSRAVGFTLVLTTQLLEDSAQIDMDTLEGHEQVMRNLVLSPPVCGERKHVPVPVAEGRNVGRQFALSCAGRRRAQPRAAGSLTSPLEIRSASSTALSALARSARRRRSFASSFRRFLCSSAAKTVVRSPITQPTSAHAGWRTSTPPAPTQQVSRRDARLRSTMSRHGRTTSSAASAPSGKGAQRCRASAARTSIALPSTH